MWVLILSILAAIGVAVAVPRRVRATDDRPWQIAERALARGALAWSVLITVYLFLVPIYDGVAAESNAGVAERITTGKQTFLTINGLGGLVPLFIPIVLTALPWLARAPAAQGRAQMAGTASLLVFVLVTALSIGLLYMPSALAMLAAAALRAAKPHRPS